MADMYALTYVHKSYSKDKVLFKSCRLDNSGKHYHVMHRVPQCSHKLSNKRFQF